MQITAEKQNQEAKHKYEGLLQDLSTCQSHTLNFSWSSRQPIEKEKSDLSLLKRKGKYTGSYGIHSASSVSLVQTDSTFPIVIYFIKKKKNECVKRRTTTMPLMGRGVPVNMFNQIPKSRSPGFQGTVAKCTKHILRDGWKAPFLLIISVGLFVLEWKLKLTGCSPNLSLSHVSGPDT